MIKSCALCERVSPYFLSLLRVVIGGLMMQHGGQKILGYPSPERHIVFSPFSWPIGIAGTLELVCGALVLVGLFTRIAAFILSGEMAVAYFMVHAGRALWPIHNGGELAIIFSFVFLYLAVAGAGPVSLDRLFFQRSAEAGEAPPEEAETEAQ